MADSAAAPVYHVLLIGVDAYPADYNSLQGCINDIDAVEAVLRDSQAGELRITRLVAPRHPNGDPPAPQPDLPTRANIVRALQRLAQPDVSAADRVLIYYSGHGDQKQWPGEP